ncbi:MAG: radical SAM protein [Planctomycetota bacterium]|nr:radical SAM protein [Planctomycetota bacterium]
MRILFVYPNRETQLGINHGLASLSAVLKAAGHETRLVNINSELAPVPTAEDVYQLVSEWQPGLIGFSCLTQQYAEARSMAERLRELACADQDELAPLVAGGIHPTLVPEQVMADGVWDHVGVGECEHSLLELVERLENGGGAEDVPNVLSWEAGRRPGPDSSAETRWCRNPVAPFPALTELPAPDLGLFDLQRITAAKAGWFSLLTSRGCPYRCTYCLNHRIVDLYRSERRQRVSQLGFLRQRPIPSIISEVQGLLSTVSGITTFILDDDLFTQDREHALEFCAAWEQAGILVPFVVNAHVKQLDPEVAAALKRAGCSILKLGIESGSERVRRRVLARPMTRSAIEETVAIATRAGLHTSGFVMVGLPTETSAELFETVQLLADTRIGRFRTSFFHPFPGTEALRLAQEAGQYTPATADGSGTTFTDGSPLDFGAEHNLLVDKVGRAMPWFVNAALGSASSGSGHAAGAQFADRYGPLVERVLAMDLGAWQTFRSTIAAVDREYSAAATAAGEFHYALRYGTTTGVSSDWFLAEEAAEWNTAAAVPRIARTQSLDTPKRPSASRTPRETAPAPGVLVR